MEERKEKFTPGPWERVQKGIPLKKPTLLTLGKWEIKLAVYHNDLEICIITDTSNGYYNASLIAAAPEMYEALSEAVKRYGKPGGPWNVPSEPGSWIEKAKAALKKARGKN